MPVQRRLDRLVSPARALCFLVLLMVCFSAASHGCLTTAAPSRVNIHLPDGARFTPEQVRFVPSGHVRAMRQDTSGILQLETDGAALLVRIPGLCPVAIPAPLKSGVSVELSAKALFSLPPVLAQVGYDAPFVLRVTPGCPEAARGAISWRQTEGLPLAEFTPSERGLVLRARSLPLSAYFPDALPYGVVAVSPRSQGRYVLEGLAQAAGIEPQHLRVTITSIARATGLSSIAVSQRVMLGGAGWRVTRSPPHGHAQVEQLSSVATFAPDVAGRFFLSDAQGKTLELQALTHDRTPFDCARSECHAGLSNAALLSPMSRAFELPLLKGLVQPEQQGCMLECHVVGEPGLDDGGFRKLAASLDYRPSWDVSSAELPHALQRMAGVRCTSCHGPGAVPAHEGRARILRASVCATCHDAPPRYGHVAEWSRSRMARADAHADSRKEACARCHTTGGFLHAQGLRVRSDLSRDPDDMTVGISCAACHAPHGENLGRALVRKLQAPGLLSDSAELAAGPSGLCAHCHAPLATDLLPAASSAALWLGHVDVPEALGGGRLSGQAPHADLPGGCIGCHGKRAQGGQKTDHSFKVDARTCTSCHPDGARSLAWQEAGRTLNARALALGAELDRACRSPERPASDLPAHAQSDEPPCPSQALSRARYALRLVSEDRAAHVHNAPFARVLLEQAAAALQKHASARP